MSQLFIFLIFSLILLGSYLMPTEYGRSENRVCEKELDVGVKIISVSDRKNFPCWQEEKRTNEISN